MEDHVNRVLTKMDSDEEKLRSLGFLGIFKESFKIIVSWKKIFTQITLFFIFPLAIIFLVQLQVTDVLEARIRLARYHDNGGEGPESYYRVYHYLTSFIFLLLVLFYFGIVIVNQMFVGPFWYSVFALIVGIPSLVLLTFLFLFGLVIQTVIYFVCKSYHCESIDKLALAIHLEAYFQSEPQSDATKNVQLEKVHVANMDAQLGQVYV